MVNFLARSRTLVASAGRFLARRGLALLLSLMTIVMSLVVIEQGRTIDTQRRLIHQLFQDSLELNAAKMKIARMHR